MKNRKYNKVVSLVTIALIIFQLVPSGSFADLVSASSNYQNVALGKPASASSFFPGEGPELTVDGSRDFLTEEGFWSNWASEQIQSQSCDSEVSNICSMMTAPPWVEVDLESPHTIDRWVVVGIVNWSESELSENRTRSIVLKGSLDKENYFEIGRSTIESTEVENYSIIHEAQLSEPVTYQYFRVEINEVFEKNRDYYAGIREIELYGTPALDDTTPPTIANDEIGITNLTTSSVTLNWAKATDDKTNQDELEYQVYQSTSSNIDTVSNIEASGTPLGSGFSTDLSSFHVTGLNPNTPYYFNVIVKDAAGNKTAYTMQQVITESAPVIDGTVTITGNTEFGQTLSADISGISYSPATTSDVPTFQWKRDGVPIDGATNLTYTLVEADIGKTITVTITADGTNATGSVTSNPTNDIEKADRPNPPAAPVEASKSTTSISLVNVSGQEYSRDEGTSWQDSPSFNGLTPNTSYTFVTRIKETATQKASASSPSVTIKTEAIPVIGGTVTITGSEKFGSMLTADISGISYSPVTMSDVPTFQWKRDGVAIHGATSLTYTLVQDDIGKAITFTITADGINATGSVTSEPTGLIEKADGPSAPTALVEASKDTTSITLMNIIGQEYSIDGGATWQDSPNFNGLTPNTSYTFVTRIKETATHLASENSAPVTIKTNAIPVIGGTVTITGNAKFGSMLTADISGISYSPVTMSDVPTYQWKRDGVAINSATNLTYTLVEADIGKTITFTITADGTNATGSVTSLPTSTIEKADRPNAPNAPVEASKDTTSITLVNVLGQEYSIDDGITWQNSTNFTRLSPDTDYTFVTRIKETATQKASANSPSVTIRTTSTTSPSHFITYNGNNHTKGTVPTDANSYTRGSSITVVGNTGNLAKTGYTFAGWNTQADGKGTNYIEGSTLIMGTSNIRLYAKWIEVFNGSDGGGSGSNVPSSPTTPIIETSNLEVDVLVNGKVEKAGTATTILRDEQTVTTITVDQKKLDEKLAAEGQHAVVTIPVNTKADVVVGELNGQMVKNMEEKQAILEIKTERATYTLPAKQININAISDQIGKSIALEDIKVQIEIGVPFADMSKIIENVADKGTFSLVVPPLEFTVRYTYGEDMSVDLSMFNSYVERTIALPNDLDPNKITTGVVVDLDGTVRHVPTKVIQIEGKYYAVINSLTNSMYSVVWHPLEFNDATNHWAKEAVNDMGSRMVIDGTGNGLFSPDQEITRAEFAAIIVRGLGLKPENRATLFADVEEADWFNGAINTAYAHQLVSGFGDDTFRPNDKITREQAMVMIDKAMQITELKSKLPLDNVIPQTYIDQADASAWAQSSIVDCLQAGIVLGKTSEKLAPKDYITRAEVAVIVQRLLQNSDLI